MHIVSFEILKPDSFAKGEIKIVPDEEALFLNYVRRIVVDSIEIVPALGGWLSLSSTNHEFVDRARDRDEMLLEEILIINGKEAGLHEIQMTGVIACMQVLENHPRRRVMGTSKIADGRIRELPPYVPTDLEVKQLNLG